MVETSLTYLSLGGMEEQAAISLLKIKIMRRR